MIPHHLQAQTKYERKTNIISINADKFTNTIPKKETSTCRLLNLNTAYCQQYYSVYQGDVSLR